VAQDAILRYDISAIGQGLKSGNNLLLFALFNS
jgi:hypothetical protein